MREIDLPVWAGAEVVGHYRLYLSSGPLPSQTGCWRRWVLLSKQGRPWLPVTPGRRPRPCGAPAAPPALGGRSLLGLLH